MNLLPHKRPTVAVIQVLYVNNTSHPKNQVISLNRGKVFPFHIHLPVIKTLISYKKNFLFLVSPPFTPQISKINDVATPFLCIIGYYLVPMSLGTITILKDQMT